MEALRHWLTGFVNLCAHRIVFSVVTREQVVVPQFSIFAFLVFDITTANFIVSVFHHHRKVAIAVFIVIFSAGAVFWGSLVNYNVYDGSEDDGEHQRQQNGMKEKSG